MINDIVSQVRLAGLGEALRIPCGSGLARESGVSFSNDVERASAFANKPAPTGIAIGWRFLNARNAKTRFRGFL
ncbi:hypothetical protein [Pseudomonas sp. IT-P44]|uniref:hypothetical protein n=1 Tax=Pseudomonas sp. IT-P44 TaxID=3026451 RepID=UPI0039E1CAC9